MLVPLFFLLSSLLAIVAIIAFRYYINRERILAIEGLGLAGDKMEFEDNLLNARKIIFAFLDDLKIILERQSNFIFHLILHFFVIILGLLSDIADKLYALSRDLFLKTATREKEIVARFWPHLKEYRREKDSAENSN